MGSMTSAAYEPVGALVRVAQRTAGLEVLLLFGSRARDDSRTADQFRLETARFWCDAAPVLQRGYEDVLAELAR
jgi:hypothetical protein